MGIWAALVAFSLSLTLQPFAIFILRRRAILDLPGERSSHTIPTPRGGGVAVMAGVLAGSLVALGAPLSLATFGTALAATVVGFGEDLRGIPPLVRLVLQAVCSVPVVLVAAEVSAVPVGVFLLVGMVFLVGAVNAVNFMDGVNGITAAMGIGGGVAYCWLFSGVGQPELAAVAIALIFACLAFLPFNLVRARVFLGDCGSYGIGAILGSLAIAAWGLGLPVEAALAPFVVYIADTTSTMVRRWRAGEVWYEPHRSHVYQRLTDYGMPHLAVAGLMFVLVSTTSALGHLAIDGGVIRVVADLGLLLVVVVYLLLPSVINRCRGSTKSRASLPT